MAETAPLMLLEATLVHVRMELEGKTAQKVSLEKPSLRTFPGCKWPFCRRRRWILGRTVSDKTSAGVIVSLLLSSCLFRLRIMNFRETWLNFYPILLEHSLLETSHHLAQYWAIVLLASRFSLLCSLRRPCTFSTCSGNDFDSSYLVGSIIEHVR